MNPRIEIIEEKILLGMSMEMSIIKNKTFDLFSTFMPRKKEVSNSIGTDVLDLIIYPKDYFLKFNPTTHFTKWALVEVSDLENTPTEMEYFILPKGKYAVFSSPVSDNNQEIFTNIYTKWLPNSIYNLDDRPHFDILNEQIQRKDSTATQEIWIPIKNK